MGYLHGNYAESRLPVCCIGYSNNFHFNSFMPVAPKKVLTYLGMISQVSGMNRLRLKQSLSITGTKHKYYHLSSLVKCTLHDS